MPLIFPFPPILHLSIPLSHPINAVKAAPAAPATELITLPAATRLYLYGMLLSVLAAVFFLLLKSFSLSNSVTSVGGVKQTV